MRNIKKWLRESNRWKHLVGVFAVSLFGTLLMGIGCIGGMEFKDCHYRNGDRPLIDWTWDAWDWQDVWAGLIGGLLAVAVHAVAVWLIIIL